MKIRVLGSGTSTGVPVPTCKCEVCCSSDPKDKRLRTSIAVELFAKDGVELAAGRDSRTIIVDTSTDFRYQALRARLEAVDAVLYTHTHADHIFGLDDLRCFNFATKSTIPLFASVASAAELRRIFSYAFTPDPNYLGGALPRLELNEFVENERIDLYGKSIIPVPIKHGRQKIHGFRFGNFAYLTDCSEIPEGSYALLEGLDTLILDGLRERPHRTHFSFDQSLQVLEKLRPRKAYLIHMTHEVKHQITNESLAQRTNLDVSLAYDELEFEVD